MTSCMKIIVNDWNNINNLPTYIPTIVAIIRLSLFFYVYIHRNGNNGGELIMKKSNIFIPKPMSPEIEHVFTTFSGIGLTRINLADFNIATNVKVEKEVILKVINGKIVALCHLDTTDKGKVFTLGDNTPVCSGHGLIRGVENNVVYLITPEPLENLSTVNTLVYSDWVPELQGTECHLPPGTQVPYRGTSHYSQHMRAPRRRFNPLQLLKMSRNT